MNVKVPWGEKNSRFTLLMERLIIDLLLACQNIQSVCRLISIGWESAAKVMHRAVQQWLFTERVLRANPAIRALPDEKVWKRRLLPDYRVIWNGEAWNTWREQTGLEEIWRLPFQSPQSQRRDPGGGDGHAPAVCAGYLRHIFRKVAQKIKALTAFTS